MPDSNVLLSELRRIRSDIKDVKPVITFEEYYNKVFDWPIPNFWLEPVRAMPDTPKLLVLIPPGHRKTTTLVAYAAWCLATRKRTRIVIVSHTASFAETILNQVTSVLASPESVQLVGKILPDNPENSCPLWRSDARKIFHNHMQKEPNLIAVGIEGNALGFRVDLIIADDIITPKNSYTYTMRNKISSAFWAELSKRLEPDGQIIVSGSRFYKNDLYDDILKNPNWKHMTLRSEPSNVLWPERFTKKWLENERASNEMFFRSQYLQEPIVDDYALSLESLHFYVKQPESLQYFVGVDPCEKGKRGTDSFAAAVVGIDTNRVAYIVDIINKQIDMPEQLEEVQKLCSIYQPSIVNVEDKGALYSMLVDKLDAYVRPSPSNLPKNLRIQLLSEKFKQSKILLPASIEGNSYEPTNLSRKFMDQWTSFGSGHDDVLDAVEKAFEAVILGGEPALNYNGLSIKEMDAEHEAAEDYNTVDHDNIFNVLRINF